MIGSLYTDRHGRYVGKRHFRIIISTYMRQIRDDNEVAHASIVHVCPDMAEVDNIDCRLFEGDGSMIILCGKK